MHTQWRKLASNERAIFFHEHSLHCVEDFEVDKVELYEVELSFLEETRLIKAELDPQIVRLGKTETLEIESPSRSYFLYSPKVTHGIKKVIPLTNDSGSIEIARSVLKTRVDEQSLVDYVKFFGLICEGPEGPFMFLSHRDEIPWSDNVNEHDRQRVIGALSARVPYDHGTGQFQIEIETIEKVGLGKIYYVYIPLVYDRQLATCKMIVTPDGSIKMDEDFPIEVDGIVPTKSDREYYVVNPTGALRKYLRTKSRRVKAGFLFLMLAAASVVVLSAFGILGVVAALADLLITPLSEGFGLWLNGFMGRESWLTNTIFIGVLLSVVLQILLLPALSWLDYAGSHKPGLLNAILDVSKEKIREGKNTIAKRIVWIGWQTIFGLLVQITLWGVIFFLVAQKFAPTVASDSSEVITLRDYVGFSFFEAVDWAFRGESPELFEVKANAWFNLPNGPTGLGETLKFIAAILVPLSLSATVARLWRWSNPKQN